LSNIILAEIVPGQINTVKKDVQKIKMSSTSTNQFLYSRLPINALRKTMHPTVKILIAVSAKLESLETLATAARYKTARAMSSNPVQ
jgi:hypothetical protein